VSTGRLISASCTAGWLDCIHGELWLLPEGLLRLRLGLLKTVAHMNLRTVRGELPTREFVDDEIVQLVARHRTNIWVPAADISQADVHEGMTVSRLALTLADGRHRKLLWLRSDPAAEYLRRALAWWGVA
jgi:hypothetical protein